MGHCGLGGVVSHLTGSDSLWLSIGVNVGAAFVFGVAVLGLLRYRGVI